MQTREPRKRARERSFTIVELVFAISLLVVVMVETTSLQGNSIYLSEYSRQVTQASFLAKRVMEQVEYQWRNRDFADMKTSPEVRDARFEGVEDEAFTYNLTMHEWKLPIFSMLGGGGGSDDKGGSDPQSSMIEGALKEVIGDDFLRVVHVEVFWPEGARRGSTELTYLLTNQRKADEVIATLKPTYDKWQNEQRKKQQKQDGKGKGKGDEKAAGDGAGGERPPPVMP